MGFYNSEEEFLSVYTACKLLKGGDPYVSADELEDVKTRFINSFYSSDTMRKGLEKLDFSNLEYINDKFYQKASKNRSWLKACFVYCDGFLFPTYEFFDFTGTTYGEFLCFLNDERYDYIERTHVTGNAADVDKKYISDAKKVADYITKFYAKKYIDKEVKNGRWPNHMKDISNIFAKDLGKVLGLDGTRQKFIQFNNTAVAQIAVLLSQNNGELIISDKKYGDLAFNNFRRVVYDQFMEDMCSPYYDLNQGKFSITISPSGIKCNETILVDEDPYEEFGDGYNNREIIL